jgi:hypothetical protein
VIELCRSSNTSSNTSTVQRMGLFVISNDIIMTYFMAIIWKKRGKLCITLNVLYSRKTRILIIRCLHCTPPPNNPTALLHAPTSANDPLPVIFHTKISNFSADHTVNISSHEFVVYSAKSWIVIRNSCTFQIIYWTMNGKWEKPIASPTVKIYLNPKCRL